MAHHHGHEHHSGEPGWRAAEGAKRRGLHKDWRAWLVVLLMLGAMAIYVLSDDESLRPGGGAPTAPIPAMP